MTAVTHIMADGRKLEDIAGHVVKISDAHCVYDLMDRINQSRKRMRKEDKKEGGLERNQL